MEFILNDRLVLKDIENADTLDRVKQQLTLDNPQYILLNNLGKWTGNTPRKLKFYENSEESPQTLSCPRGFADRAYKICKEFNEKILLRDERRVLEPVDITFYGTLHDFQKRAVTGDLFKNTHGVLSAGTGSGKTVMALYIIASRRQPALVVVHTVELLRQWQERIETFLGIPAEEVGIIGGGKFRAGEKLTVGLYQSIRKRVDELKPIFGHIIVDECHKCPSKTFTEAVSGFDAKFRLGLTATGYRRDKLDALIFMTLGELRHTIEKTPLVESGKLCSAQVVCRQTEFETILDASLNYPAVIKALSLDHLRNSLICRDIAMEDRPGIRLVLTDRREHALTLKHMLENNHGVSSEVLTGNTPKNQRESIVKALGRGEVSTLMATGQLIGEGFDLPELATLFLVMPIKFKGRLIQYIGRILRPAEGKSEALIYDYIDLNVGVLKASATTRIETYRKEGITVDCKLAEW
ncbi:conserved hypothetical protein [Desulfamplus magnetovallimortis]|uniref:Type III restriction protein res subunit n=1 Tax=Desulfamplus magnetovallimortis TaxID=1246637 RepID=A0A1W1H5Y1_9BACT|nr:DEAD/DEAH box helicase [Desulfamplus magnetovallimortis]SLM27891.1 conserved hypothetical protein [Desulfamplus magnetovallimortis]